MKVSDVLIIFVKNVEPGKVKTRLAASVGADNAIKIYNLLLRHTERVVRKLNVLCEVWFSKEIESGGIWASSRYKKKVQQGEDLGHRMRSAFAEAFLDSNTKKAVIIGSDCAELESGHLEQAYSMLVDVDLVIGPARDGGYYLLGMKELHSELFSGIAWSSETVLASTLEKAEKLGLTVGLLSELNDVDTIDDWERVKHKFGDHD